MFCSFRKKGGCSRNTNGAGRTAQFQPLTSSSALSSDFDSEDELQIDESPPPRRRPVVPSKKKLAGRVLFFFLIIMIHSYFCLSSTCLVSKYKAIFFCSRSSQETTTSKTMLRPTSCQRARGGGF